MAHIPSGVTADLELVTFRQALEAANTPSAEYDIKKWLYAPNFYSEYRYILGTRGNNPLICIGINPSTARPDALDNTLKSVERIALGNGFDCFIMFNVYAQRATSPDDMEKELTKAASLLATCSITGAVAITKKAPSTVPLPPPRTPPMILSMYSKVLPTPQS